ncbi:MAG: DUF3048 domain-containing protein [Patescibacteria group bacterium]
MKKKYKAISDKLVLICRQRIKFKFNEIQLLHILAGAVAAAALALFFWFAYLNFWSKKLPAALDQPSFIEQQAKESCEHRRVLDGACVDLEEKINPKLVAIMIDNQLDARPQIGLDIASVVYEAPVEGNFTRFMAIFSADADIDKVGPVRSVRPYFIDWASEYGDAMFMHVGGSPDALDKLKIYQINSVNEFYRGWYFWRSKDRYAPHNTYTSGKLWSKALKDYKDDYATTTYSGWLFDDLDWCAKAEPITAASEGGCAARIEITFLPNSFDVVWEYNTSTQKYERSQMGRLHKVQSGGQIEADTIIVEQVQTQALDSVGRLGMETIGSGDAIIFARGHVFRGKWRKDNRMARTRFFDLGGDEIKLQAGKIWVEVANQRTGVDWM